MIRVMFWFAMLVGQMTQGNPCLNRFNWTWFHHFISGPEAPTTGADLTKDGQTDMRDVALFQNLFVDGWVTFVN